MEGDEVGFPIVLGDAAILILSIPFGTGTVFPPLCRVVFDSPLSGSCLKSLITD